MNNRKLRILAPTRYPWRFNGPRQSTHDIENRSFLPLNKISQKIEGITLFNPLPPKRFDLIHAFNRIPIGALPFVIGFESHLPRAFELENTAYYRFITELLASPRCRKIVAISRFAENIFRATHAASPLAEKLFAKLTMRYPSLEVPEGEDAMTEKPSQPIIITFVGNHFGRKGGCVAVRVAEIALKRGFPLTMQIVSTLQVGPAVWTDPADKAFFERYLRLLDLPNVRYFKSLPNRQVLSLLRHSHLSVLATFTDTFGYSAVESMMNYTPVIATRQAALPEFIEDNENGILLDLPVNALGEWQHHGYGKRDSKSFRDYYASEIERLSEEVFCRLENLAADRERLPLMRANARREAIGKFDVNRASEFWDALYEKAVSS